jgi:TldD protein
VAARQGTLVLQPSRAVPPDQLRALLLEEVRRQGLDHGLLVRAIGTGFTTDESESGGRLRPSLIYRVYTDGRPDQLVRAGGIGGEAGAALAGVLAAGDDYQVWNAHCDAESGVLPVSAVSPSLLLRRLELVPDKDAQGPGPALPPPSEGGVR